MSSPGCKHPYGWHNNGRALLCQECGALWPGHKLPTPVHQCEGYGELANQPSWRSRVDAMVQELRNG
jgi:hypothetical protein